MTWKFDAEHGQVTDDEGGLVAFVPVRFISHPFATDYKEHVAQIRANRLERGRMLAAAPELLEACKAALATLENMTTESFARGADKEIRAALADAIAKASR